MPTSLIFVVLLGVWAAYFAQYWLRRRDHLATARSVEQFSEAMRVLERRPALPRTDLSQPDPRSYAVHPARSARPQVIVKRAVAAEPVRAPAATTVPDAGRGHGPGRGAAPSRGASGRGTCRRVRPSRRVRGLVLLTFLLGLLTVIPLVALSLVPLWALAPAAATVVAAFFWVRSGVRAERALSRAGRRRPARGRSSAVAVNTEAPAAVSAGVVQPVVDGATSSEPLPAPPHTGDTGDAVAAEVVAQTASGPDADHFEALPEAVAEVMAPIVDEDDIPLTWDPVPVPRPTYTMKAKAERPEVAPAATTPEPVRHEGAGDGTAYDERRVAGA